eukprot:TRINITY_DN9679_c0_g1_i2.p1 TRINITY_DN9679_c0_g1~~TRINITY_DN9679_c0_g1_i2.p1  ORF type:complete len:384 (+),score=45.45 TRINITY_DN9679_c0_g1_i2:49-1200(+)
MAIPWHLLALHGTNGWCGFIGVSMLYSVVFLIIWLLSDTILRLKATDGVKIGAAQRITWALKVMNLAHHGVVAPLALIALVEDPAVGEAWWCKGSSCEVSGSQLIRDPSTAGTPFPVLALVPISMGYMAADLMLLPAWSLNNTGQSEIALMVAHHSLSMISWPFAVIYDFCARYVLFLLVTEISSVFLVTNWMLSNAGYKKTTAYLVSGLLFTASFLIFRWMGAIPQLRAMWYSPPWKASPEHLPGLLWWMPYGSTWLLLPHALNLFWGIKVVKGAVAVVLGQPQPEALDERAVNHVRPLMHRRDEPNGVEPGEMFLKSARQGSTSGVHVDQGFETYDDDGEEPLKYSPREESTTSVSSDVDTSSSFDSIGSGCSRHKLKFLC